ncbi:MAG: CHAT domain-containing protein, partial [Planctomycetes bacterium]|nr:CHAT domain-containing protein [Planctomycetota bacterium]
MRMLWAAFLLAPWIGCADVRAQTEPSRSESLAHVRELLEQASTASDEGQHDASRARVREAFEVWKSGAGLEDDPTAIGVLNDVAHAAFQFADAHTAEAAWQRVFDAKLRHLPEDDPGVLTTMGNLAAAKYRKGDLAGALVLMQRDYEFSSRVLEDHDESLQSSRSSLAALRWATGDAVGALAMFRKVLDVYAKHPPEDATRIPQTRINMAAALFDLEDYKGAMELQERALAELTGKVPEHDLLMLALRGNLGVSMRVLGDARGALGLHERVLETCLRSLPEDHPRTQIARANLATTRSALGDLSGARELLEAEYAATARILPADHLDLQRSRELLARARLDAGDLEGAVALLDRALEVYRELPESNPRRLYAELSRATMYVLSDEQERANEILTSALAVYERTLPRHHPQLLDTRWHLVMSLVSLRRFDEAGSHFAAWMDGFRESMGAWVMSPRERAAVAREFHRPVLDTMISFALGAEPCEPMPWLAGDVLVVSQLLRGIETRAQREVRRGRSIDSDRFDALRADWSAAAARVTELASAPVADAAAAKERDDRLHEAVRSKAKVERQLDELVQGVSGFDDLAVRDFADHLPEGGAGVAVVGYEYRRLRRVGERTYPPTERRYAGIVFDHGGDIRLVPIGAAARIDELVADLRAQCSVGAGRGSSSDGAPVGNAASAAAALRRAVLDPILQSVGSASVLYVSFDDSLELVPWDALPDATGKPLGARIEIRRLISLCELLEDPTAARDVPAGITLVGGVDYGAEVLVDLGHDHTATPIVDPVSAPWAPLPATGDEVDALAELFEKAHPAGRERVLRGSSASKQNLFAATESATFIHVATHGYFAPPTAWSRADQSASGESHALGETVSGISPFVLTGLALSGANRPPDSFGRRPGIVTAQELLTLDLSSCELVTLSACDTTLGVRRSGQAYASL